MDKRKPPIKKSESPDASETGRAIQFCEQRAILKAITDKKYRDFFYFCCCTGMRVSEALSVKVKNIDFRKRVIRIDLKDSKTKKHRRDVPFVKELFDGMDIKGKLLFPSVTYEGSGKYFCQLYKRLNLDLNRHSTRHTFVSELNHIGVPPDTVMLWAGHTDLKMTTDTYTHVLKNGSSPVLSYLKKLKSSLRL